MKEDNAQELAGLMEELLSNDSYKQNVKAKHDYYISEYSWDAVARRMKEAMDKS